MATPRNWQALFGDFEFESGVVKYRGGEITSGTPGDTTAYPRIGIAMCDLEFEGGVVTMTLECDGPEVPSVQVILFRDPATEKRLQAGIIGGPVRSCVLSVFSTEADSRAISGWRTLRQTGMVTPGQMRSTTLTVVQRASTVEVSLNGVVVLQDQVDFSWAATQCGLFIASKHEVHVRNFDIAQMQRKAFVVMQFTTPYNELYTDVIKPIAVESNLIVERSDETAGPGLIIADIVRQIRDADIIIADITPQNENVFYELGFAHGINKPTILIADRSKKLPFDVSPFRTLFYDNTIAGKAQVESGLRKHLAAILSARL